MSRHVSPQPRSTGSPLRVWSRSGSEASTASFAPKRTYVGITSGSSQGSFFCARRRERQRRHAVADGREFRHGRVVGLQLHAAALGRGVAVRIDAREVEHAHVTAVLGRALPSHPRVRRAGSCHEPHERLLTERRRERPLGHAHAVIRRDDGAIDATLAVARVRPGDEQRIFERREIEVELGVTGSAQRERLALRLGAPVEEREQDVTFGVHGAEHGTRAESRRLPSLGVARDDAGVTLRLAAWAERDRVDVRRSAVLQRPQDEPALAQRHRLDPQRARVELGERSGAGDERARFAHERRFDPFRKRRVGAC